MISILVLAILKNKVKSILFISGAKFVSVISVTLILLPCASSFERKISISRGQWRTNSPKTSPDSAAQSLLPKVLMVNEIASQVNSMKEFRKPISISNEEDDKVVQQAVQGGCSISNSHSSPTKLSIIDNQVLKELEEYVAGTLQTLRPCSAGIVVSRRREIIFEKYVTGIERQKPEMPVNESALWPMLSCTKSFVAAMLLSLVTDGVITLDDPVSKYLPEFEKKGNGTFDPRKVTIRHLASHTSGATIAGKLNFEPPVDLNRVEIITEPGSQFVYSSLGMHILERAIEAATGEDFAQTLEKRVFQPLSLKNARYIYEYDPTLPMLPCKAGDFSNPAQHFALSERGQRASTGLYMTTKELNLFSQLWLTDGAFKGHRFFDAKLKKEVWKLHGIRATDGGQYGLLWWLFEQEGGYVISGGGYSVSAIVPRTDVVVTVTRNNVSLKAIRFDFHNDKKQMVILGIRLGKN